MTLDLVLGLKECKRLMELKNNDFNVHKPRKCELRKIVSNTYPVLFERKIKYKRVLKK